MLRIASIMLIAVMMSTCAISGTFAKYVTTGTGSDNARVAKWGVTVTPNGELFLRNYTKTDGTYTVSDNTVESSDTWKLVAPGTSHGLTEVQLTGTPEVAVRITYDAVVNLDGWVLSDGTTEYCPVYFTIEGKTYGTDDSGLGFDYTYTTVEELKTAIVNAVKACGKDYAPNTDLSGISADAPTITWTWAFETGHDVEDTDLGNKAAAGNYAVIQLTVTTTVTQID